VNEHPYGGHSARGVRRQFLGLFEVITTSLDHPPDVRAALAATPPNAPRPTAHEAAGRWEANHPEAGPELPLLCRCDWDPEEKFRGAMAAFAEPVLRNRDYAPEAET
jgi:hypothetical protein